MKGYYYLQVEKSVSCGEEVQVLLKENSGEADITETDIPVTKICDQKVNFFSKF